MANKSVDDARQSEEHTIESKNRRKYLYLRDASQSDGITLAYLTRLKSCSIECGNCDCCLLWCGPELVLFLYYFVVLVIAKYRFLESRLRTTVIFSDNDIYYHYCAIVVGLIHWTLDTGHWTLDCPSI